jgi:hypothetical protein
MQPPSRPSLPTVCHTVCGCAADACRHGPRFSFLLYSAATVSHPTTNGRVMGSRFKSQGVHDLESCNAVEMYDCQRA